jgi:hypothetical protein
MQWIRCWIGSISISWNVSVFGALLTYLLFSFLRLLFFWVSVSFSFLSLAAFVAWWQSRHQRVHDVLQMHQRVAHKQPLSYCHKWKLFTLSLSWVQL